MLSLDDGRRRALLVDRQLVGAPGRAERSVLDVARSVGPLHSTDPSTAYLQIAARSDAAIRAIAAALYDDRALLRHTTLRRTVHLLTPELAVAAHGAYNHRIVPKLRQQLIDWLATSDDVGGDPAGWLDRVEDLVVDAVHRLDRPSGTDLADEVPELRATFEPAPGRSYSRPMRSTSKILEILIADGRLARDRPRGDLTSGAWTYSPIERWLPDGLPDTDPGAALVDLLAHRLRSFPGCSDVDLAWWTGLPKGPVRRALDTLGAVDVALDDGGVGWIADGDDLDTVDPPDDAVALLPGLDATPMGTASRDWFLGGHVDALFDRNGNVGPTVWWRGRIVGGWTQRADGGVVTGLLDPVPASALDAIDAEARRVEAWLGDTRVRWRFPTPLQRRLQDP